jgi:hypothetical protein
VAPPWLWVFVYGMPSDSAGWLMQSGLGRFLFVAEGFSAMLGQLARWFYPFGSGAHCNNNHYYSPPAKCTMQPLNAGRIPCSCGYGMPLPAGLSADVTESVCHLLHIAEQLPTNS